MTILINMDAYKTLGVSKTATQDEIKSAYRKLAKKLHPDLNPGNKKVEEQFKEVNKAYEFVGTPEARGKYDRGETPEQQQEAWREQTERAKRGRAGGAYGGGGPSFYYETQGEPGARYSNNFEGIDPEMFENIFGAFSGGGAGSHEGFGSRRAARGQSRNDQTYSMEVDFNTAVLGGEREIVLPHGKKLSVKIPAGVKSGTKLRLTGQAEGSPAGDLYLEINVLNSNVFRRLGFDIETDLPLSLSEAVLGGEIKVQTVDGAIMLKVPAGVSSGARIRVKGKGVPHDSNQRGDLYAVVKIVMPTQVDPSLTDFFKTWSESHSYNPRTETSGGRR